MLGGEGVRTLVPELADHEQEVAHADKDEQRGEDDGRLERAEEEDEGDDEPDHELCRIGSVQHGATSPKGLTKMPIASENSSAWSPVYAWAILRAVRHRADGVNYGWTYPLGGNRMMAYEIQKPP
jgi:hypothetical protein